MSTCYKAWQMDKSICFHLVLVSCFTPCWSSRPGWLFAGLQRWREFVKEQLARERESSTSEWGRGWRRFCNKIHQYVAKSCKKVFNPRRKKDEMVLDWFWGNFQVDLHVLDSCSQHLAEAAPGYHCSEVGPRSSVLLHLLSLLLLLLHQRDPTWPPEGASSAEGGHQRPTKANEGQHWSTINKVTHHFNTTGIPRSIVMARIFCWIVWQIRLEKAW